MTVEANDRRKEYAGNDVTTVFDGPRCASVSQIQVYFVVGSVASVQSTGFTVTRFRSGISRVTFSVAPPSGVLVRILRVVPFTQEYDITNQSAFLPETIEQALDGCVYQVQQIVDDLAISGGIVIGGGGGVSDAASVSIVDSGGYFSGSNVEIALQEAGAAINGKAAKSAPYLLAAADAGMPGARTLAPGANVSILDGGPGGSVVISALSAASGISISDAGGHFSATNVEDALQEVGADKANTNFDNVVLDGSIVEINTSSGAAAGKRGENIQADDASSTGGFSVRYAHLIKSGEHNDGSNDIGDTLILRYNNVTSGSAWGRWDVVTSPLNPASGLPGAPASSQGFFAVIGEANPQNRYGPLTWQGEARRYANPVGGWQMVAETQDFSGALGGARVGYSCSYGYLISKSPYNCTVNGLHATFTNGFMANPNAISPQGAFLYATGHKDFPTAVAIANAGTGYTVGDKLTFNTGLAQSANENTVVEVTSVGGGGAITGARIFIAGWYQQPFASTVGVTGGSGTGATFTYTLISPVSANIPRAWGGITGLWDYGLDGAPWNGTESFMGAAEFLGGMIRAPNNNKIIVARNAADSADVTGLLFNASNQWEVGGTSPVKFAGNVGFYGASPVSKPAISGYVGSVSQQQSVVTALASLGLVTNSTTAVADDMVNALQFSGVDPTGVSSSSTGLQAAINAAAGATLVIPKGTYKISSALLVPSNTTIIAYGANFVRSVTTLNNMLRNDSAGVTGGYGANSNITIMGGSWDSSVGDALSVFAFGHCTGVTLRDVEIASDTRYHHIEVNACDEVLIVGCRFTEGFASALTEAAGGSPYNATLNEAIQIDAMVNSGAFPWFGPYDSTPCKNVTIKDCVFKDVGSGVGTHSDNGLGAHTGIKIVDCKFANVYDCAIKALSWWDIQVTGCRFEDVYCGVYVTKSANRTARDINISGNTFYRLGANTTNPPTAYHESSAVKIEGTNTALSNNPRNIRVVGNVVDGVSGANSGSGIRIDYTAELATVANNTVVGMRNSGIYIHGGGLVSVTGNSAKANNVAAGSHYDILMGNTGVSTEMTRGVIVGNTVATIGITWSQASIVRDNNVYTSLTESNNASTVKIGDNLVVNTFA